MLPTPARGLAARILPGVLTSRLRYWGRGERAVIQAELERLRPGERWSQPRSGYTTGGMSERVIEIPWVLSRLDGARRVLDVGPALAIPEYLAYLTRAGIPDLHGVDLLETTVPGMMMSQADVRKLPYADGAFDLVTCISTLEHIGMDNSEWHIEGGQEMEGDLKALQEIRRVLSADGRLLVTVPFGEAGRYGWFRQYSLPTWAGLIAQAGLRAAELQVFAYEPGGWKLSTEPGSLEHRQYRGLGAPGASALLCAALTR